MGGWGRWYVPAALGGNRKNRRYSTLRAIAASIAALLALAALAGCGGDEPQAGEGNEGNYEVEVTSAEFPAEQRLGQTSLMKLGIENTGDKTIPALSVTVTIAGEEGETSSLPFAVRDPQPDLAQPDRPVWVLAEDFPQVLGSPGNAGTSSASDKSFDFGPLKAGRSIVGLWKLSAVRRGDFKVAYRVDADLSGRAKAEIADGEAAVGSFDVKITEQGRELEVTDSGEVVEIGSGEGGEAADGSGGGESRAGKNSAGG